ncbi:ORF6N domain-containing protein [Fibrobacter succinogenes]
MMKNDVPAVAKSEFPLIDENMLKSRIYTIRGLKVMLDADLAEIYGYSTKAFNQQIKNNIEKFDEDFRFQLNFGEIEELSRCKICTMNMETENKEPSRSKFLTLNKGSRGSNIKYAPYAFTEQGIYMLMTVLKGERATAQSKALIRLFKQMKDYIIAENRNLLSNEGLVQIAVQTERNTKDIAVIQSDLQKVMENFVDPSSYKHFLILNGKKLEADVAYTQIYGMAKKSIAIIDDYVGVKTLDLLRGITKGVSVAIYSDEQGFESLTNQIKNDFSAARPDVKLFTDRTRGKIHDRYIFLDYGLKGEKLFHCGASSKDAGNKITTIMQIENTEIYHILMDKLKR